MRKIYVIEDHGRTARIRYPEAVAIMAILLLAYADAAARLLLG